MKKLIDVDEIKKMYPIMENDFGMVVNERLHENLDKIPPAEAMPLSVIDEIKTEIEKIRSDNYMDYLIRHVCDKILKIIDQKIKEYKETEEKENG